MQCKENPEANFQGNHTYSRSELEKVIAEPWGRYLRSRSLADIDDAAYALLLYYRQNGYYFSAIDYEISGLQVIFKIQEYEQVVVKGMDIKAAESSQKLSFSDDRLRKFLKPPPLLGKHYLDKIKLTEDVEAIIAFYRSEGYLNQSTQIHYRFLPEPPHSREVRITISIQEGPRFYLDRLDFEGNEHFDTEHLRKLLEFKESKVFHPQLPQELEGKLRNFYRKEGYARVQIEYEIKDIPPASQRQGRQVLFRIQEGKIHHIRSIQIQGNETTSDSVVYRQMDIKSGDRYDLEKIQSSKQNLHRTGLFLWTEIEEKPAEDDKMDLLVSLEERKNKNVTFRLGYATSYGVIGGIDFEHINIFGTGRRFLASAESTLFSSELSRTEFKLELWEPQLLESRTWSSRISLFLLLEDTPTFSLFDRGGGITFLKKFSPTFSAEFGYHILWSEIVDVKEGTIEVKKGLTFFSTFSEKFILNLRDDDGYPTSGGYHFIELEQSLQALGADVDYAKFYLHSAWYFKILERCVWSVAIRAGVIVPFGDTEEVPAQKRFFSGGAQTIRSFQEKELPPLDANNKPIGGEGIFLLSTELRIPIYENFGMSVFVDSGQIIPRVRKFRDYRISHLKYAVGAGLWYTTPIGPIRFDLGFNPDREENPLTGKKESLLAWFISIGFSY